MPDKPYNTPAVFDPESLKGLEQFDPERRVATLLRFVKEAEPGRQNALDATFKQQCYRRNRYRIETKWVENKWELQEEQDQKELDRPYHSINFTLGLAMLRAARYLGLVPEWVTRMDTGKESDRYIAEVVASLLKLLVDPEREREKPMLIDSMVFGAHTVLKVAWDPSAGVELGIPRKTRKETPYSLGEEPLVEFKVGRKKFPVGKAKVYHEVDDRGAKLYDTRMTGAPVFRALGPMEFNFDPTAGARGVHAAQWAFDSRRVSAEELYRLYPKKWDELRKFVWSDKTISGETERNIRGQSGSPTTSKYSQTALLFDFYYKPAPNFGLDNGAHECFITNDEVTPKPGNTNNLELEWGDLKTPRKCLPYIDGAVEGFDGNDWWGFTMFNMSSAAQQQVNLFLTLASEAAEAGSHLTAVGLENDAAADGEPTIVAATENMPRGVRLLKVKNNFRDMKNIGSPNVVPIDLAMMKTVIELVESATNTRGTSPAGMDLATEVKRALEQDRTVIGATMRRIINVAIESSLLAIEWIQQCASPDDIKGLLVQHDKDEVQAFFDSRLRPHLRLEVKGAALIDDPAIILQLMNTLPQMPGWDKIFSPQTLADMLSLGRRFGQTQRDYHVERAERENTRLRKKDVPVDQRDDNDVHDYVHGLYYIANYDYMDDDERTRRRTHMDKHKENRLKALEDQARQAVLAKQTVNNVLAEFGIDNVPAPAGPQASTPQQRTSQSAAPPPGVVGG